jgi:prepilin-type N-terminal cleavage/methylation domain-containing protein
MAAKNKQKAFTLHEMIVAISIIVILSGVTYYFFSNGQKLFALQNYQVIAENQALNASTIIQRELKEARSPGMGLPAIEQAESHSIIFYADITDEGANNKLEKVEYLYDQGEIRRGLAYWNSDNQSYDPLSQTRVICQYMVNSGNPVFTYYDANYTGSEPPLFEPINLGAVRMIKIHLEIDPNPNRPPEAYSHDLTIQLRNPNL